MAAEKGVGSLGRRRKGGREENGQVNTLSRLLPRYTRPVIILMLQRRRGKIKTGDDELSISGWHDTITRQ